MGKAGNTRHRCSGAAILDRGAMTSLTSNREGTGFLMAEVGVVADPVGFGGKSREGVSIVWVSPKET